MKNVQKNLVTVGLVAGGVIAAGFVMYQFRDNDLVAKARNGFQGVA